MTSGQTCPLEYRYSARTFSGPASHYAETVYVVGGLYGNLDALHAILRMREAEVRRGVAVSLVFNGDHNWFNIDAQSFQEINDVAVTSVSIRGNVEAELAEATDAGCGCNYPDYVNADYVACSNAIMERLASVARGFPRIRAALKALPLTRTIHVGSERIGIVHGDAEALSGWAFAAERLSPIGRCCSGDATVGALTPSATIERFFREADVRAFACTHTCLAHARDFEVDGVQRLIINNGAAGIPNFAGLCYGLVTRISVDLRQPAASLYGIRIGSLRFDALPVHYDQKSWLRRFSTSWPAESPAHRGYFSRLVDGPDFSLADAIGGAVERYAVG